jgi:hypothetical protein
MCFYLVISSLGANKQKALKFHGALAKLLFKADRIFGGLDEQFLAWFDSEKDFKIIDSKTVSSVQIRPLVQNLR